MAYFLAPSATALFNALTVFAGKATIVNVRGDIKANTDSAISIAPIEVSLDGVNGVTVAAMGLFFLFGVGGVLYGRRQKQLRESALESLAQRNRELERALSSDRSGSMLTSTGKTRPEDE